MFQHRIIKSSLPVNKKKHRAYVDISSRTLLVQWGLSGLRSINTMLANPLRSAVSEEHWDTPTIAIFVFAGSRRRVTMVLSCSSDKRLKIPTRLHSSES